MTSVSDWITGARPKTLPAAIVPVAVGTAAAANMGEPILWWRAAMAMIVALALQVGTNYANDYSDGIRGTDDDRSGPARLVGSGLVEARLVKVGAFASFGVAGLAGLSLAVAVGWELVAVGVVSIAAGWFYTGGANPYGYMGFGELFVFVFFGLVATVGSAYVQPAGWSGLAWLVAIPVGLLAAALLVANNLRDIPTDAVTGKRTLAVRMGDPATRLLYQAMIVAAFVAVAVAAVDRRWALLALVAAPLGLSAMAKARSGATGRELIPLLEATGRTQLVFGLALSIGLALG